MSENKNNVCDTCGSGYGKCGQCGNMCGFGGGYIVRWILGILIIVWIFSIGMRFGELKANLEESGYGRGYKNKMMPMMGGWSDGDRVYFSGAVPTTSATPTTSSGSTNLR